MVERVLRSESNDKVKISPFENKSNSKQCISGINDGISFECFSGICSQNFSNPSAELGRVKVAKHNLKIKTLCVYLVLITLYLFDPVLHGWTRTLRIINYLPTVPKKVKHKAHLISDENCQICETIKKRGAQN